MIEGLLTLKPIHVSVKASEFSSQPQKQRVCLAKPIKRHLLRPITIEPEEQLLHCQNIQLTMVYHLSKGKYELDHVIRKYLEIPMPTRNTYYFLVGR